MRSRRSILVGCIVATALVWLDATPALAAVQSAGVLDRATQLFQASVTKWGNVTTHAAQVLFWMLATIACVWELGGLALRGGSMDVALAFLLRFGFIEGLWFWIIQYAVPIGTAIIDSLRKLGSLASGRPQDLMPSSILDAGFAILWKTIKFVFASGLTAPVVSFFALLFATAIFITFVFTALNMVLLIVSQWFLLYGGIFFLGFGGLPSESDKAKNYLYLCLSIGAQLFVMAGIVGIGQSFIEAIYAQLSGDTSLGELAVILCVALVIYKLANEIPKMFAQFVPGAYSQHGFGGAAVLGGLVTLGAAFTAATAMAKSAATNMAGMMRAASAAHNAAKAQSQPHFTARSQTGVSAASGGGSIGPAGVGTSARAQTHTQGPLGSMLASSGIGPPSANGGRKLGSSARTATNTPATRPNADAPKAPASPSSQESANDSARAARTSPKTTDGATPTSSDSASQPTAAPPRGSTKLDQQVATPEPDSHAAETSPANADTPSGSMTDSAESAVSDGETLYAATRPEEAHSIDAPSSESSEAHAETSPTTHEAASNAAVNTSSDTVHGTPASADTSTSTPEEAGSASSSAASHTQTSAANARSSGFAATTVPASGSSTAGAAFSASSPASGSSSTAAHVAGVSTQAAAASVPATTTTSEQSTHGAASNANSAGSSPAQSRQQVAGRQPTATGASRPPRHHRRVPENLRPTSVLNGARQQSAAAKPSLRRRKS